MLESMPKLMDVYYCALGMRSDGMPFGNKKIAFVSMYLCISFMRIVTFFICMRVKKTSAKGMAWSTRGERLRGVR